jgi:hypothetical protein
VLVLVLPRELVESARPVVDRQLARRPDAWGFVAARGKLRRFLGDPSGLADLRQAGETYLKVFAGNVDLLTAMNLHRLAGSDASQPLLEQLRPSPWHAWRRTATTPVRTGPDRRLLPGRATTSRCSRRSPAWTPRTDGP